MQVSQYALAMKGEPFPLHSIHTGPVIRDKEHSCKNGTEKAAHSRWTSLCFSGQPSQPPYILFTGRLTVDPEAWIILTTGNDLGNDPQPIPFHPFPSPTPNYKSPSI